MSIIKNNGNMGEKAKRIMSESVTTDIYLIIENLPEILII